MKTFTEMGLYELAYTLTGKTAEEIAAGRALDDAWDVEWNNIINAIFKQEEPK